MRVDVPLRSIVDEPTPIRYRFLFFSDAGDVVEQTPERAVMVPPKGRVYAQGRSRHVDAYKWLVIIDGARRGTLMPQTPQMGIPVPTSPLPDQTSPARE